MSKKHLTTPADTPIYCAVCGTGPLVGTKGIRKSELYPCHVCCDEAYKEGMEALAKQIKLLIETII